GRRIVGEGDAQEYADRGLLMEPPKEIKIAQDERGLRDDSDGVVKLGANFEAGAGQAQGGFHRLIAIGDAREDDELARPRRLKKSLAQEGRGVRLDHQFGLKVRPRPESQVLVRRARIAVRTGMETAPVRIHTPSERQIGTVVVAQDRSGVVFVDLDLDGWRRFQIFPVLGLKRIRRVTDQLHWSHCSRICRRFLLPRGPILRKLRTRLESLAAFRKEGVEMAVAFDGPVVLETRFEGLRLKAG